ncbi:MAG: PIG-L family deacetylase [Chloroflexia bacterium]|nr:PIG-L family deacetylase [Chloroflexia bacterium]
MTDPSDQRDQFDAADQPVQPEHTETDTRERESPTITASYAGKRVLLIQAHPDDAEFVCAGTIARWAKEGADVHYLSLTSGDKGSSDPAADPVKLAATREAEQRQAAEILGVRSVAFLGYSDAMVVADLTLRRELVRVIRRLKPDVLLCMDPTVRYVGQGYINHPDHVATGEAALAAVFPSARDRMTFPELLAEGLEPHKVAEVFLFGAQNPDVWVDISASLETKLAALKAHTSQMGDWDPTEMIHTWSRETAERHPDKPADFGEFAESFKYFKLD